MPLKRRLRCKQKKATLSFKNKVMRQKNGSYEIVRVAEPAAADQASPGSATATLKTSAPVLQPDHVLPVYQHLVQALNDGVTLTDCHGAIIEANKAFSRMSGYSRRELLGKNPRIMKSDRHPPEFFESMWSAVLKKGSWEGEVWDKRKDGTIYPKWLRINAIKDKLGKACYFIGIHTDLSGIKATEQTLNQLAYYDSLTGLPNRVLFQERLLQAINRAMQSRNRLALLYLDLDQFKHVNDSFGHHAGDLLLQEAAGRLSDQVRDSDTVCRLGGDEFTVILENIKASEAAAVVAGKIINCLKDPFVIEGQTIFIGTSIGIALFPFDGNNPEELTKRADAAMYDAKSVGRGVYRFASGSAGASSRRRLETQNSLRQALDRGELFVEFQPQTSAGGALPDSDSGILGAEALVRWRQPTGTIIYPDNFIDVAEETGLIVPIGEFVLRTACQEAKRWLDLGRPLSMSVNVSQLQFEQGQIIRQVERALADSGLPPRLLKLEITESLFSRNMHRMAELMHELQNLGLSFALDDFGTGYSSLRYIDRLPFDTLKIDKSFIQRIDNPFEGGEIATAIVSMARSFGMESIAEGVETVQQLEALRSRGCDSIQGFYVSRPMGAEAFRTFISQEAELIELEAVN